MKRFNHNTFRILGIIIIFFSPFTAFAGDPVASIQFSDPIVSKNCWLNITTDKNAEAYTEVAEIGGSICRKIPAGKYLYVRFDKTVVPMKQKEIMIRITYWDHNSNSIWFNYNASSNNFKIADFNKSNSKGWATTLIPITDAKFGGQMSGGCDIRLGYNDSENYIKEITLEFGKLEPDSISAPEYHNTVENQFKEKSFAGYQIWHKAGPNPSDWVHWSYGKVPAAGSQVNVNIASFPDLSEYPDEEMFQTNLAPLGNGRPTKLYNDADKKVIDRQLAWLKKDGLDGVAIQRFVGGIGKTLTFTEESHLSNVKTACEANGKLFYMCYDLNGSDATIVNRMKIDWIFEIEQARHLTESPNYATVDGKPVVEIWGIGYNMATPEQCLGMIQFFHDRGCYLIGGVPGHWLSNGDTEFTEVYKALDAISPWTVGVYNSVDGANNYLKNRLISENNYCIENGMDLLPVCFAGSGNWLSADGSFSETDRLGGKLLWQQIINAKSIGLKSVYFAMLDEFEESTNLINGAVDYFDIPTDQYFETWAKDGIWVSSNYYLRLAGVASRVLRDEIPQTDEIPIPYSNGPIYFRNSFESRDTKFTMNGATLNKTMKIDPCFYHQKVLTKKNINEIKCTIEKSSNSRTGLYSAKITGKPGNATESFFYFQTSETKIDVKADMQLTFWKYTETELGRYTNIDLTFKSGKTLSALANYTDQYGNSMNPKNPRGTVGMWEKITCQIGHDELVGDQITGIAIAYDHPETNGTFTAWFDDIIIENSTELYVNQLPFGGSIPQLPGTLEAENFDVGREGLAYHDSDSKNTGEAFRADEAVEIEATTGNNFAVHFDAANEWIEYTVNIAEGGKYNFNFDVASTSEGCLKIEVDGVDKTGLFTIASTGGKETWKLVTKNGIELKAGVQVIRINCITPGFYLNSITVEEDKTEVDQLNASNMLLNVYPNPAKAEINITFTQKKSAKAEITLFNMQGQNVKSVSVGSKSGSNTVSLNIEELPEGIYFVRCATNEGIQNHKLIIEK